MFVSEKEVLAKTGAGCAECGTSVKESPDAEKERMKVTQEQWRCSVSQMRGNAASYWSLPATTTNQRDGEEIQ